MYLQIMEQIKQKVAVEEWTPGYEISSIRTMAVALRVSVNTVNPRCSLISSPLRQVPQL
jgi:GntR family transcriptional regulator